MLRKAPKDGVHESAAPKSLGCAPYCRKILRIPTGREETLSDDAENMGTLSLYALGKTCGIYVVQYLPEDASRADTEKN